MLLESNASYQYQRHYTLANGTLISQSDALGSFYFLQDAQGSTRALSDGLSGAVTSSYDYDAFGNLAGDGLLAETRYLYTGQQFDPYTELYSLRARYYDPSVGRFLSRDTWAYDYKHGKQINRYVYTSNNPLRYIDPSGYADNLPFHSTNGSNQVVFSTTSQSVFQRYRNTFLGGMAKAIIGGVLGKIFAYAIIYTFEERNVPIQDFIWEQLWTVDNALDIGFAAVFGGLLEVSNAIVGAELSGIDRLYDTFENRAYQQFSSAFIATLFAGVSATLFNSVIELGRGNIELNELQPIWEIASDTGIAIVAAIIAGNNNLSQFAKTEPAFTTFFVEGFFNVFAPLVDDGVFV